MQPEPLSKEWFVQSETNTECYEQLGSFNLLSTDDDERDANVIRRTVSTMLKLNREPETKSFRHGAVKRMECIEEKDESNAFGRTFFADVAGPVREVMRAFNRKLPITKEMVDACEPYRIATNAQGKFDKKDTGFWGTYICIAPKAESPAEKSAREARGEPLEYRVYTGSCYRADDGIIYRVIKEHESLAYALRTPSEHYRQTHGIKYRGDVDFKPTGPFKARRKIKHGNTKITSAYIDEGVEFTSAHYWVHAWEKDDSYAENGSENWKKWRMVEYLTMIEGSTCLFVGGFNSQVIRDALVTIGQREWIGLARGLGSYLGPEYFGYDGSSDSVKLGGKISAQKKQAKLCQSVLAGTTVRFATSSRRYQIVLPRLKGTQDSVDWNKKENYNPRASTVRFLAPCSDFDNVSEFTNRQTADFISLQPFPDNPGEGENVNKAANLKLDFLESHHQINLDSQNPSLARDFVIRITLPSFSTYEFLFNSTVEELQFIKAGEDKEQRENRVAKIGLNLASFDGIHEWAATIDRHVLSMEEFERAVAMKKKEAEEESLDSEVNEKASERITEEEEEEASEETENSLKESLGKESFDILQSIRMRLPSAKPSRFHDSTTDFDSSESGKGRYDSSGKWRTTCDLYLSDEEDERVMGGYDMDEDEDSDMEVGGELAVCP